jgi:hypothetical protein
VKQLGVNIMAPRKRGNAQARRQTIRNQSQLLGTAAVAHDHKAP